MSLRCAAASLAALLLGGGVLASPACVPDIQRNADGRTPSLRLAGATDCRLDEAGYRHAVQGWLGTRLADEPLPSGLALGRIDALPWLVDALASAAAGDAHWLSLGADASAAEQNRAVARLLSAAPLLDRLDAPFAGGPLAVTGVGVEKVRLAPAAGGGRRPVDAQVWLRLGPWPPGP